VVTGVHKELIANLRRLNDPAASDDSITTEDAVSWIDAAADALEAAETPTAVEWGVRWGDNFRGFGIVELNDQASCSQYVQKDTDGSDDLVIVKRNVTPWEVTP
jgi:hypothetical protein